MVSLINTTLRGLLLLCLTGVLTTLLPSLDARAQTLICNITEAIPNPDASGDPACDVGPCVYAGGTVAFSGQASDGVAPYDVLWELPGGEPPEFGTSIASSGGTSSVSSAYNATGSFNATFTVKDSGKGNKTQSCSAVIGIKVVPVTTGAKSINSTSQNTANAPTTSVPEQPAVGLPEFNLVVANDLGMHCADIDYQVFSILPPFNVFHAQIIQKGTGAGTAPSILDNTDVELVYSASSNALDPALQNRTTPSIFKGNFWQLNPVTLLPYGFEAYDPLYPTGVLSPAAFEPDLGIPVPDVYELYLGGGTLVAGQQAMPGITAPYVANHPQHFDRYDPDFPFFINFPFGYTVTGVNWFAADGIPALPVDDQGRNNAYPLFRVQAIDKTGNLTGIPGTILASTDAVAPVASEADCQNCHVDPFDCTDPSLPPEIISTTCNGSAVAPTEFSNTSFIVENLATAPGDTPEQQLLNAAKINILRLHDAKHGTAYTSSIDQSATPCDAAADPNDGDCLDNRRPVQCSWCHYSPALDIAQVGPIDEPSHGVNGRQQTRHISMSRAMHGHHGQFTSLFPDLPPPNDPRRLDPATGKLVINDFVQTNLEQNCYQCHPGKRTQCLRGTMFAGGMVCQDCHGNMAQVGDDFTQNLPTTPFPAGADLSKRVPWATEPGCQSCHTGDAVDNLSADNNTIAATDTIRLLQAYRSDDAAATPIVASNRRFAENQTASGQQILYRLSKGHGGVFCEACHGSTHSIWPVKTPNNAPAGSLANDNIAAIQLQGHDGKIQECDVCHQRTDLGHLSMPLGLDGPHGMHPVNDERWNLDHKSFTGSNNAACRTCHGLDLTGTPLSVASTDRVLVNKRGEQVSFTRGHEFGCGDCHKQKR